MVVVRLSTRWQTAASSERVGMTTGASSAAGAAIALSSLAQDQQHARDRTGSFTISTDGGCWLLLPRPPWPSSLQCCRLSSTACRAPTMPSWSRPPGWRRPLACSGSRPSPLRFGARWPAPTARSALTSPPPPTPPSSSPITCTFTPWSERAGRTHHSFPTPQ